MKHSQLGQMLSQIAQKPTSKKWFLTAALFAVLTLQNAFQFSSLSPVNKSGEFNMSSETVQTKTEASTSTAAVCTDNKCVTTVSNETLLNKIADLEAMIIQMKAQMTIAPTTPAVATIPAAPATTVVATPAVVSAQTDLEFECGVASNEETRQEKSERTICEREFTFKANVQFIIAECDDNLSCISRKFSKEVSRYKRKNSLSKEVVIEEFQNAIGKDLSQAIFSKDADEQNEALKAIQTLISKLPDNQRGLKKGIMDAVEQKSKTASDKIVQGYQELNTLSKQNNTETYFSKLNELKTQSFDFHATAQVYTNSIVAGLEVAQDMSLVDYYQSKYLPNVQKMVKAAATGIPVGTTTTMSEQTTTRQQRDGSTLAPQTTQTTTTTTPSDNKLTRDNTIIEFDTTTPTNSRANRDSTMSFGTPTSQQTGTRGSRNQ